MSTPVDLPSGVLDLGSLSSDHAAPAPSRIFTASMLGMNAPIAAAQTPESASLGEVDLPLRTSDAAAPVCRYCDKPDASWLPAELQRGRRWTGGTLEYHCYEGYAWD